MSTGKAAKLPVSNNRRKSSAMLARLHARIANIRCDTHHDRDLNAALNLKRLATETALPVASPSSNGGAVAGMVPAAAGKVTPVRYECGLQAECGEQATSGQEESCAHLRALS